MKKTAIILGMMSLLTLCTFRTNVQAADTTSISDVIVEDNNTTTATDNESGNKQDIEVRVRVLADDVKIRENPFPWAKCIQTANKGENFKYTGHYIGYYLIYVGDKIAFISDNAKSTETYTVPLN